MKKKLFTIHHRDIDIQPVTSLAAQVTVKPIHLLPLDYKIRYSEPNRCTVFILRNSYIVRYNERGSIVALNDKFHDERPYAYKSRHSYKYLNNRQLNTIDHTVLCMLFSLKLFQAIV